MLLPHGTVIAIIDGQHFELFRNAGNEAHAELAPLPAPVLDSHNRSGTGQHSHPGNHADSDVSEGAHANAAAAWLNAQVIGHKIEKLVVIAPPRSLGELRRHYHKQTEVVLLREVAKELSGRKAADVLAALKG